MIDSLINVIFKTSALSKSEIALCKQYFEPITVKKNSIIEEEGKVPEYLFFVTAGYMRLFYNDADGNEVTTFLCSPNQFIAPFLSFINRIKSTENVSAVTNCKLLRINAENLKKLIETSESFKNFSLTIFEHAIFSTSARANDLATLNAEQRYKKILEQQPQLVQNIPIQFLASYLGMKPESLSRIRRQIIS